MSRSSFELLRIPVALVLIGLTIFILWPRGGDTSPSAGEATARPSVVVGEPGGVIFSPSAAPASSTAAPTVSSVPTPSPATAAATPTIAPDQFAADVQACRSISGAECRGPVDTLPPSADSLTALVRFTGSRSGDAINAVLQGPSGTFEGGAYSLQGGGDGYYFATFAVEGLQEGEYTLTATRNGDQVARTSFVKGSG